MPLLPEPIVIVGLGNPGKEYAKTRHNAGFLLVDKLAEKHLCSQQWSNKDNYLFCDGSLEGRRVFLVKPMTFMNRSGEPLRSFLNFRKLDISHLIICHDELDLEPGTVPIKKGGGEGGHNGLRSISDNLSSSDYLRVRLGVGRPPIPEGAERHGLTTSWVLSPVKGESENQLSSAVLQGVEAVKLVIKEGVTAAQNRVNQLSRKEN